MAEPGNSEKPCYYPITIDLDYRVLSAGVVVQTGRGRVTRSSSTRLEFECADYLPEQSKVEISIAWPARVSNDVGLRLWVAGRTLLSADRLIVVEIQRYEFRTRGARARETSGPARKSARASAANA
jgi:hypothetical protein